ncbi:MAG: hypothetical protein HOY44_10130 [Maritimibacter sp.]|uniref:hypothetical protein n=1 Tax=Maritimibacter sp. TaxID=2003363 RepID=UPI001E026D00|nr:hypothetical protein [Maritimibacter sp.]MBL6427871.1 hypothetical protein [Maritimibacter sp.]
METNQLKPPASTQRIWRVADLPKDRAPARYLIEDDDGDPTTALLSKRRRQVMELLKQGPVYCASPVRISDIVHLLKRETGVIVDTEYYPGDTETGAGTYGVYFLRSTVNLIQHNEVAA